MIYFFSPYSFEKNLGQAYNEYFKLVPKEEDWICFTDLDSMFLIPEIGNQLQNYINKYPETGLFTCLTNRVGNLEQCYKGEISNNSDILYHKKIAIQLKEQNNLKVKELKNIISGHLMLIQKGNWRRVGGFKNNGVLAIDNDFSKKILLNRMKILLMEEVYLLHYYRFLEGISYKQHLKKELVKI